MKRIIFLLIASIVVLASCSEDPLDPRPTSELTDEDLWSHATYGEGLLGQAYSNLSTDFGIGMDYYTDNGVPKTPGQNGLALGQWTVENNPLGRWNTYYESIKYLNKFMEEGDDLTYEVGDPMQDSLLRSHRIGEAHFLRAWYQWKLLQHYAGYVDGDSEAKGFPIVTSVLTKDSVLNRERDSYEDCVEQIAADLDEAISILPLKYDGSGSIYGLSNRGRGSGLAAMALKARVYLYAASPAYSDDSQAKWERAAQAAYDAIEAAGGLTQLKAYGNFNEPSSFDHIWIQPTFTANWMEANYYPPSLYGNGNINPSQNLVDAFPAADGYPIDQSSLYSQDNPYKDRDPRFERFIFHNGEKYNGTFVRTHEGGTDAPGGLTQLGTRTGYYMEKHLSHNVRLNPGDQTTDIKFKVYLGKTELYLAFAEAANEAFGPNDASLGYSAADAMRMIRQRAGIDSDPATSGYQDQYLEDQASAGKDAFRNFIHNERRVELCFEGHRFWDIRRWEKDLNHTVQGVRIATSQPQQLNPENIALESAPSSDFVSPYSSIDPINSGTTDDIFHNWPSAGTWRYVQYDFPSYLTESGTSTVHEINESSVYWWTDGGGVLYPDSVYVEVWDQDQEAWVEVWHDWDGVDADQWNTASFTPVETSSVRMHFKSNTQSCGMNEWEVYGVPANPISFTHEYVDVEDHTYQEYMRYVPLPYNETLIMDNLLQNSGW